MTLLRTLRMIAFVLLLLGSMVANAQPWSRIDGMSDVILVGKHGPAFRSIQAALDTILDASEDNPYLVYVTPGVYVEQVGMKPYVDIEGAGRALTKIVSGGNYVISGASHAELRSLTLEQRPPSKRVVWTGSGQSLTISDVTIKSSRGIGIDLWYAGTTVLRDVRIESTSGSGIRVVRSAVVLDGVSILLTNGAPGSYGIAAFYPDSILDISNSVIVAEGPGSQGILGYGTTALQRTSVLGEACAITVGTLGTMTARNSEIGGGICNYGVVALRHSQLDGALAGDSKSSCFSVHDASLNRLDKWCQPTMD